MSTGYMNPKSSGFISIAGGVQQFGDSISYAKNKKVLGEDIYIENGFLMKRPGRRPATTAFDAIFDGVHEYIDPDNEAHLLVKIGRQVIEIAGGGKNIIDTDLEEERTHFFTHRGRCRYNSDSNMRKITRTTADRVGIDPPDSYPLVKAVAGGVLPAGDYAWKFTFVIEDGEKNLLWESNPGEASELTLSAASSISIKCAASTDPRVNARYIYRTTAGGALYEYVGRIEDNLPESVFNDTIADPELGDPLEYTHGVPLQSAIAEGANERQFFIVGEKLYWSENAYTESYLEYEQAISFKELPSGGWGTGLKKLYNESSGRDDLYIFQADATHLLPGADPNQPIVTLSHNKGAIQQDTIVEYGGGLCFLTKDNQVIYVSGATLLDISSKVIPESMGKLLNPETASATLLNGHFYALCCREDSSRIYNHQVWIFDLDTIQAIRGQEDRSFAMVECWRWNLDAQYLLQRKNGDILAFDNNSLCVYAIEQSQICDESLDGSHKSIPARFQMKFVTEGLYTRSQPINIRVKGEQTGTMNITPLFLDNFPSTGSAGHSIPNIGTVAIAGHAVSGHAVSSQVQKHIETNFYVDKSGECFSLLFEKLEDDPFFKLSGFEMIYRTFKRAA
jgi:hypothetical protein